MKRETFGKVRRSNPSEGGIPEEARSWREGVGSGGPSKPLGVGEASPTAQPRSQRCVCRVTATANP